MKKTLLLSFVIVFCCVVTNLHGQDFISGLSATQSTDLDGSFPAANAVDGDPSTFSTTENKPSQWLRIDLGGEYQISKIIVRNRISCCPERLAGARVGVSNTGGNDVGNYSDLGVTLNTDAIQEFAALKKTGRYILIHKEGTLHAGEVEVFGTPTGADIAKSTSGSGLSQDDLNRIANANKPPVVYPTTYGNQLISFSTQVESGDDISRKIIYNVETADEVNIIVGGGDDVGDIDDVWIFRTEHPNAVVNIWGAPGTVGSTLTENYDGVSISGVDHYIYLRKTDTNTYFASSDNLLPYIAPEPPVQSVTVTNTITSTINDIEEVASTGAVSINSGDLNFQTDNIILLVFENLNIPQDATIENAVVTFQSITSVGNNVSVKVEAENGNAATPVVSNGNISNRTTTASSVAWNNVEAWSAGVSYDSVDISTIVQEWKDRGGYSSTDNLGVIISHVSGTGRRFPYSANGSGSAPSITITYNN